MPSPRPSASNPAPSAVRAWAREQGYAVADRGRLSDELVTAYVAAHEAPPAPRGTRTRTRTSAASPRRPRAKATAVAEEEELPAEEAPPADAEPAAAEQPDAEPADAEPAAAEQTDAEQPDAEQPAAADHAAALGERVSALEATLTDVLARVRELEARPAPDGPPIPPPSREELRTRLRRRPNPFRQH